MSIGRSGQGLRGGFAAMLGLAFTALGLLWVPLAFLRQIDAFAGFLTPLELARDASLGFVLMLVPALLLAVLGTGLSRLLRAFGCADDAAAAGGWGLVLAPLLWVVLWQVGGSFWMWLKTSGLQLPSSSLIRVLAALLLLALLALLVFRVGLRRLFVALMDSLARLRSLALFLLLPALACIAITPPRLLREGAAPTASADPQAPDIFLFTIDTLAEADARLCTGGETMMPRLRDFARRATCFSHSYSSANFTTPATATMETGALPWNHWAVQIVAPMARGMQAETLAARLAALGYETISINANLLAAPRHHGSEGSWHVEMLAPNSSWGNKPREWLTVFADTTLPFWLSGLVPFLDTLDIYLHAEDNPYPPHFAYAALRNQLAQPRNRPRFIWVHTLPPHDPYLPPPETRYRLLPRGELDRWSQFRTMGTYAAADQTLIDKHRLRYRESMLSADAALGQLLDELKAAGQVDQAIVAITADHGESFAHGYMGHAGSILTDDVLRVPLLIRLPHQAKGQQIDMPVSLADLAPTLADLAGARPLPHADGRSLRPALEERALPAVPVFAMAMEGQSRFTALRKGFYAVIDGQDKLVLDLANRRVQMFDLAADPTEAHDLSRARPERATALRKQLETMLSGVETRRRLLFP